MPPSETVYLCCIYLDIFRYLFRKMFIFIVKYDAKSVYGYINNQHRSLIYNYSNAFLEVHHWKPEMRKLVSLRDLRHNSLSARILHRAPPPRLQVDQHFLTQKIVADSKMRCHQKSFGIWRVTEAILGQKTCFFFQKHIFEKIHNKSHYFFNF